MTEAASVAERAPAKRRFEFPNFDYIRLAAAALVIFSHSFTIAQGTASTRNLRIRSVQAVVLMEGRADIARETQDLRVWVVPEINAGAASLAYAVINPAIGLGTFLGQLFLRRPLIEAGTREFKVTGSWTDPKVDRVERKAGDAVPSLEPPPAASGPAR